MFWIPIPSNVPHHHSTVHTAALLWRNDVTNVLAGLLKRHLAGLICIVHPTGFYRAMLCIRGTSHRPVSVSVSFRLSQAGVLLKRQNVGSHKQHHMIPLGLYSFLKPKISAKFDRGHPLRGRRMQVGWVKIGDFWQINGYISKTVKDKHIVSIKVE